MRRRPADEWRDHLKPQRRPEEIRRDALLRREPEEQTPTQERKPGMLRAMYVGSQSPALRGRTALVMHKRSGSLMAQFDWPSWQQFDDRGSPVGPVDPFCLGWHEFTEGEFQALGETWGEREDREQRERRQADRAHRRALADFGGAPMGGPSRAHYYDPSDDIDDEWEYGMDHLVGLDGWGSD